MPVTLDEARERGWDTVDFVYICGDAYVDHPSFGHAIITRLLEAHGFRVGIIAQPDWKDPTSICVFGEPRLGFLVSAGNMDSMVNHYTVAKKRRHEDSYSPGGQSGLRPDRACTVYGNLIRRTYKKTPIILGGIEASLRRLAHYDYWSDKLKRSVLMDSSADIISYGMGEHSIVAIAEALDSGLSVADLTFIPGTVYRCRDYSHCDSPVVLPSFEDMQSNSLRYAESFALQSQNLDPYNAKTLVEEYPHDVYVVQNPPAMPLTADEFDAIYQLPFARTWHPNYDSAGGVPALKEVKFSLTSNRGCLGDCAFCALNFHQGRIIQARSHESLVEEATRMTHDTDFKGVIHDVGGPTANFRIPACSKQAEHGACPDRRCLSPQPCKNLKVSHTDYLELLRKLRKVPGVNHVFVRSGIRFDYVLLDDDDTFFKELVKHHVSGQLRLAPEHVSDHVLKLMGKPPHRIYERFVKKFDTETKRIGKKQFIVPYLMSSHPGSTLSDAVELAEYCRDMGFNPEQVQDFYPTPSTLATCMYFTGRDPRTMEKVYVARDLHEKALQRALIQYRNPKNADLVREALQKTGREDLIGDGSKCLVHAAGDRRPHASNKKRNSQKGKPRASLGKARGRRSSKCANGSKRSKGNRSRS